MSRAVDLHDESTWPPFGMHEEYDNGGAPPRRTSKPAAPPQFKTAAFFCSEYVPLSYVVEPIVRTASVYTLTAKTGGGKTALAVILCLAVATGRADILGMDVITGRVAYCAFENPDDVRMRIMAAAFLLNVNLDDIEEMFVILDARTKPELLVEGLSRLSVGGEFCLIVVDTFAAGFDGTDINDNVQAGEYVRRLRPLTQMAGLPAVLITAHPTKNASDDQIVPYGGGAILNEVDGNLTLCKQSESGNTRLHWQGKFRGIEFQPINFRFEITASPEVQDSKGRQVQLPTLRPTTAEDADDRVAQEADLDRSILRCLSEEPVPSIREIGASIGRSKSVVGAKLARLGRDKLVEKVLDKWNVTAKGRAAVAT